MAKELLETEQAQVHYEQCLRYVKQVFHPTHYQVCKTYLRMADNMMRERGNQPLLKRASAFLAKNMEILKEILEIENDDELDTSNSLYLALYW